MFCGGKRSSTNGLIGMNEDAGHLRRLNSTQPTPRAFCLTPHPRMGPHLLHRCFYYGSLDSPRTRHGVIGWKTCTRTKNGSWRNCLVHSNAADGYEHTLVAFPHLESGKGIPR